MSAKTLKIVHLERTPKSGTDDDLLLNSGVNLIVGKKDTGKTAWLRMLDYVMGDDSTPIEALGETIATKYDAIQVTIAIEAEQFILERRWKEIGSKTKVFVNGQPIPVAEFSQFLLKKLNIPVIHFPKGNPYAERAWPELSWRMLYRHIYRKELYWTDFVDKQPPVEQAACLLQFLAVAEAVYPSKYGALIQKQNELQKLQGEKEAYSTLLHSITTELLEQKEISVAVTEEAVQAAEHRLQREKEQIEAKRSQILEDIKSKTQSESNARYEQLRSELIKLDEEREEIKRHHEKLQRRVAELTTYANILTAELERFNRAKTSGELFADLKVTQCPVCDQDLEPITVMPGTGTCYLCRRGIARDSNQDAALKRVCFEEDQLKEEKEELVGLLEKLRTDAEGQVSRLAEIENKSRLLNIEISPARQLVAQMLPPDLCILDREIGRIQEKFEQLRRVRRALATQKDLLRRMEEIQLAESELTKEVAQATPNVNLGELGDIIQERMNQYLNKINEEDASRWQHKQITFALKEKEFTAKVKGGRWNTQIGATSQALMLFAYHYALLSLVGDKKYNYPGLVIIDFPLQLADGTSIAEAENYLVKPFIELCGRKGMENTQFIAAGRAFENLPGSHQIYLQKIW